MKHFALLFLAGCATATNVPEDDAGGGNDAIAMKDTSSSLDTSMISDTSAMDTSSSCSFSGVLATWDFTMEPGNQPSTASKTSAPGVTAGAVQRSNGLTATAGAGSINSSNWPTGALDPMKYYFFTLQPPNGCTIDITTIAINTSASGTGPAAASIGTSADNYASKKTFTIGSNAMVSLTASGSMLEVRVYGYTAGATGGTLRIQSMLSVSGSLK